MSGVKRTELNLKDTVLRYLQNTNNSHFQHKSFDEILELKENSNDQIIIEEIVGALSFAYDKKYGDWEKFDDLRILDIENWFMPIVKYIRVIPENSCVLTVGMNDGRELIQLFGGRSTIKLDINDISKIALEKAELKLKEFKPKCISGDFLTAEFAPNKYNLVLSLRTINSSGMNLVRMIEKSKLLLNENGTLLLSVSNGYLQIKDGINIVTKGMLEYSTGVVSKEKPYILTEKIKDCLIQNDFTEIEIEEGVSEIFIISKKK